MGNKHSSTKSQTPNYGRRMASTHDISDLEFQEPPVTESSKKKTGPPPCPGKGCEGCWVCDWD